MPASVHDEFPSGPLTPPDATEPAPAPVTASAPVSATISSKEATASVLTAVHVISTERAALAHLEQLYQTDGVAQENLVKAVNQIVRTIQDGGKLVCCGVGKSGKIARKVEATMNSLGVFSMFLHPTEALHGDLGVIRENDTLLLISFSGRTQELMQMLPHIPPTVPVIAITSHLHQSTCPILSYHSLGTAIALPAPIHENEESSIGVSAPTSSTTAALALGDALAITIARRLHNSPGRGPAEVFKSFHPGGAIGAATAAAAVTTPLSITSSTSSLTSVPSDYMSRQTDDGAHVQASQKEVLSCRLVPFEKIPVVSASSGQDVRLLDIVLAAVQNPDAKSWVLISSSPSSSDLLIPARHTSSLSTTQSMDTSISTMLASGLSLPFVVPNDQFLRLPASIPLDEARRLVNESDNLSLTVIAGMDDSTAGTCLGVMGVEDLWSD